MHRFLLRIPRVALYSTSTSRLVNYNIPFPEILLINESGENKGQIPISEAIANLPPNHELVLVNERNKVCKIVLKNLEIIKKLKSKRDVDDAAEMAKRHRKITKEYDCKCNISRHDLDVKLKKAADSLFKNFRVRCSVTKGAVCH